MIAVPRIVRTRTDTALRATVVLVASFTCACGSRTGLQEEGVPVGPANALDSGAERDVGADADAGADAQPDVRLDTAPPPNFGLVSLGESGGTRLNVTAEFHEAPLPPCWAPTELGKCRAEDCTAGPTSGANAGVITVSNSLQVTKLTPDPPGGALVRYPFVTESWNFSYGAMKVVADGFVVPAFKGSMDLPFPINVIDPPPGTKLALDDTAGLVVKWVGGAPLVAAAFHSGGGSHTLTCLFDGTDRTARVPAASLQAYRKLGAAGAGTVVVAPVARQAINVGTWRIDLVSFRPGYTYNTSWR